MSFFPVSSDRCSCRGLLPSFLSGWGQICGSHWWNVSTKRAPPNLPRPEPSEFFSLQIDDITAVTHLPWSPLHISPRYKYKPYTCVSLSMSSFRHLVERTQRCKNVPCSGSVRGFFPTKEKLGWPHVWVIQNDPLFNDNNGSGMVTFFFLSHLIMCQFQTAAFYDPVLFCVSLTDDWYNCSCQQESTD